MKLSGSHSINAPRERVWAMLNDIEALRTLIPGVQTLEETELNTYKGVAKIGVAGVKGQYIGTVELADIRPPQRYRLIGQGCGRPGHVKGEGLIESTEQRPNTTPLRYNGDVQVGGSIAGVGQQLIEGTAKLLINQGLKALAQRAERQG